jgi:pimeloyl-ACP methyl ester carboxylesterase
MLEGSPAAAWAERGISRRTLLRLGRTAGLGLAGLALVGCGDDDAPAPREPDNEPGPAAEPTAVQAAVAQSQQGVQAEAVPAQAPSVAQDEPVSPAAPAGRRRLMPGYVCTDCTIEDPAFEPLDGARAFFGIEDGAGYRIEVPDDWNGTLILWGRGFGSLNDAGTDFDPVLDFGSPPPGREILIPLGVGWAASTYSATGYVPARGVDDLLTAKAIAIAEIGEPERTYCIGASMGGATAQLMAQEFPGEIDGALALCGALSNAEVVDYLVGWHAIAHWLIGDLPSETTAGGFVAWAEPLGRIDDNVLRLTPLGEQFAAAIRELSGGERWGFRDGLARNWRINFGLGAVYWPTILAAGDPGPGAIIDHDGRLTAFDTEDVVYRADPSAGLDLARLNAELLRFRAPAALRTDPALGVATGRLEVPLLTLKTTGDMWTPISLDRAYARRVELAGYGHNLVQRAVRRAGHCNFSELSEGVRAFFDLVRWVTKGERPAGEVLTGGDLSRAGVGFTNPFDDGDPLAPSVWALRDRRSVSV